MRFKLDENLGRSAVEAFESAGHDVSSIHRQQMAGADDRRVFDVCRAETRILVTFDLDFANPLVFDPQPSAGVAVLRLPKDAGPTDLGEVITTLLEALKSDDIAGSLWIARAGRVRRWQPQGTSGEISDGRSDVA